MYWTAEKKTKVKEAERCTYDLLQELGDGTYKKIRKLQFSEKDGTADCCWADGQQGKYLDVTIYAGDPAKKTWAIAHELGHGVHELYRGSKNTCGESSAEAIRYFAENRFNPESEWLKAGPPSQDRVILDACQWNWDRFKEMFAARNLQS